MHMHQEANTLLRTDVEAFNAWRLQHPGEEIDLAGEVYDGLELFEAYLVGINFTGCSFRAANLQECILSGAILDKADCTGANLSYSQLGPAELINASLHNKLAGYLVRGASLRGTLFTNADLSRASFRETDIEGADFRGAKLDGAKFFHTNHADAKFDDNAANQAFFL